MLGVTFIWKTLSILSQLINMYVYVSLFETLCLVLIDFLFFFQKFTGIVLFRSHRNKLNFH